jgi:ABC-type transport system involved in cytochrome bd biosynthesis fused ATPase/permease subunit
MHYFNLIILLLIYKTRLFVTNSIGFLSSTDQIIFMENGSILEMDSYEKLVKKDAQFNSFVKSYFQNNQNNIEDISI